MRRYNAEALCWPGSYPNGCFENSTATGEAVVGLDLHRDYEVSWTFFFPLVHRYTR